MSQSSNGISGGGVPRAADKVMRKPIAFRYLNDKAKAVFIAGDFNDWDTESHPLKRGDFGGWEGHINLSHGRHRYVLVVDGECVLDPNANGTEKTEEGYKSSLLFVS